MEEKFKYVLNENEKVLFVTNATNSRCYSTALLICFMSLFFLGMLFVNLILIWGVSAMWLLLYFALVLVITLVTAMFTKKAINNYYICLTNERVIIRRGIFTTDFDKYSILNVSGNLEIQTDQSIFDRKNESACSVKASIELLPVGHGKITIWTWNLNDGIKFSKVLEKTIKDNAKALKKVQE